MKRKLTFRAWDGIGMSEPWGLGDAFIYWNYSDGEQRRLLLTEELVEEPDLEVVQFTGLRDKNGVEIFEGDIVEDSDYGVSGTIAWHQWSCGFTWGSAALSSIGASRLSVVGNIFEHPNIDL